VPTASERLRRKLDLVVPALEWPGRLLYEHPRAGDLYPRYLAASAYLALGTPPLLEMALARARALGGDDAVAAGLAEYLERHIPEETHGDEPGQDVLDDLEALGIDTTELRARPLPPKIAAVIGTQAFWIWHAHPVAVLGFLEIEAYHPDPASVERLIEKTGLPREGFRQLLLHAKLDAEHAAELHRVLDALPLELYHEQLVGLSALQTIALLNDVGLEIVGGEK
jgi:Iron-containing redox enzyme